jgi:hypothetical protein
MIPSVTKTEYKTRGSIKNSTTWSFKISCISRHGPFAEKKERVFRVWLLFWSVGGSVVREKAKSIKVGWKSVYKLRESSFQFPACLYNVPRNR